MYFTCRLRLYIYIYIMRYDGNVWTSSRQRAVYLIYWSVAYFCASDIAYYSLMVGASRVLLQNIMGKTMCGDHCYTQYFSQAIQLEGEGSNERKLFIWFYDSIQSWWIVCLWNCEIAIWLIFILNERMVIKYKLMMPLLESQIDRFFKMYNFLYDIHPFLWIWRSIKNQKYKNFIQF